MLLFLLWCSAPPTYTLRCYEQNVNQAPVEVPGYNDYQAGLGRSSNDIYNTAYGYDPNFNRGAGVNYNRNRVLTNTNVWGIDRSPNNEVSRPYDPFQRNSRGMGLSKTCLQPPYQQACIKGITNYNQVFKGCGYCRNAGVPPGSGEPHSNYYVTTQSANVYCCYYDYCNGSQSLLGKYTVSSALCMTWLALYAFMYLNV